MEELLQKQHVAVSGMRQLWTNFKKDGQDRKTSEYIKKRIETLNSYWNEFQKNHEILCMYEDKTHDYFIGNHYEENKAFYLEVRESIQRAGLIKPALFSRQQPGAAAAEGRTTPVSPMPTMEYTTRGTDSKFDEKLRKQTSNFKAFVRLVTNIDLSAVEEKWEFEDILRSLEARWRAIDDLHWKIDSEFEETDDNYEASYTQHELMYSKIKKEINRKLWSVSHREKSTPQLDIPIFNGNYQSWVSFKDLFTEAIHGNPYLSAAQKMQFLKSKIKGEAERLIQHLPISSDNYVTCWEILNHRYNNKKLIFSTHMNTLMNIPVIQQATSNHVKRIHDVATECLNGMKNLGINIDTWDPIIVHILTQKMDSETLNEYFASLKQPRELPSLKEYLDFLENKFTTMESARRKQDATQKSTNNPSSSGNSRANHGKQYYVSNKATSHKTTSIICPVCNDHHGIYYCKEFKAMAPELKGKTITQLSFCTNCLFNHSGKKCTSSKRCQRCKGQHNTLLHDVFANASTTSHNVSVPVLSEQETSHVAHVAQQQLASTVLLATAIIKVSGADGIQRTMRALIDQGSQISLITENAAQQLGLPRQKCSGVITGVGMNDKTCKGMLSINCTSLDDNYKFSTKVLIMKNLTRNLPNSTFSKPSWAFLEQIELADPQFYISNPVDILLGADIYAKIIMNNVHREDSSGYVAQETRIGWILFGEVQGLQCNIVLNNIQEIQHFWEIEDIPDDDQTSYEEDECIKFYASTTTRLEDGRYQVRLPLKSNFNTEIGESKPKAVAQLYQIERKLARNKSTAKQYKAFIDEYLSLGHMKPAHSNKKLDYYLPHHCVLRDESTTTSLRVVFNASSKTSTGASLNDCMYTGPNLQKDLMTLILKWRQHRVAFIADIEKMFRQIWAHEDDQNLQKIVWRDSPNQSVQEYQLTTVTYGTKAAPFLAMMTLKQLANDERQKYPNAARVVEECFYMDDLLHGSDSVESAKQLQQDLKLLLKTGGFNLRKWRSNYQELQENTDKGKNQEPYDFKQAESTKTLGLHWNSGQDIFSFQSRIDDTTDTHPTKRKLLSEISKLFDPLGWLTPVSIKMKLLFQDIWKEKNLQWDDKIPEQINREWTKIKQDIKNINLFQIPRWIGTDTAGNSIELHGFCDASQKAFACVVYCKITNLGQTKITLLVGKSRIVPNNKNISLPKLELSGAHLLSKLMAKVMASFTGHHIKVYGWTDSMAVLGWIQGDPDRWRVFVGNRVRQITKEMPSGCWRYVKSAENPADCASRGLTSLKLKEHDLWWNGPSWLPHCMPDNQTTPEINFPEEEALNKHVHTVTQDTTKGNSVVHKLLTRLNSFTMAVHVMARLRRLLIRKEERPMKLYLTLSELRKAKAAIIKDVQHMEFQQEIHDLKKTNRVSTTSKILNLNPFVDEEGILRVGGRLHHAAINPDLKHPIILPHQHRLTELIIRHAHKLTFHGGARITLACIRQKYWIIGGNNATKKQVRECVTCRKQNPKKLQPQMGDLPAARINPSRPFMHTGVDFTGHVYIKTNKGRGVKTTKGYVSVFVCMVTKAVHLELVSDLTSSSFIAALRRMAARRGTPCHMYSDNGRNFVGASKVLQKEYQELQTIIDDKLLSEIADMEITWHFNAPSWPSAGGLWEAAVKSFKLHLKRVIGEQKLTYEEFTTLLTQIEACLNSRPLCAISEDPEDLDFLTPSHFLTGGPTLTLVETERDLRTRWQLTQKILHDLWKRWRTEYLTQLTVRSKWRQTQSNIKLDDVVLIHDDNLPAGKWMMGKVVELHPGQDGHVRVVTLKTKGGTLKRPVLKVSVLLEHKEVATQCDELQEADHQQAKEPSTRRSTKSKFNFTTLVTTLMLFFTFITSSECNLKVTPFQTNQSLYFDKVANMMLIRDDWKLVVYYSMDSYWQSTTTFNKYIQSLKQTCDSIQDQVHCDVIVLQLRHAFSELQHYNQVLLSQHSGTRPGLLRPRRGLINGVGYIANSLFGVLDESFAEKYRKDISLIQENEKHIVSLWRNQTSLMEAENNLLKRTEHDMNQQLKLINRHMNKLDESVGQLKNNIESNSVINDFNMGALIASNMMYNLKSIQNMLLDTVTDIYNGRFNLHLITPDQLINELSTISSKLPKDVTLPIDNLHSDLRKIYDLLEIKTRLLQDIIIFEIKLPLISRDSYETFKIIPIPKTTGRNDMISIISVSQYISINMKKDTYIKMSEEDLRSCLTISEIYYCHILRPIYQIKGDKNFCETENSECKTISSSCKDNWQETHTLNNYFYFCCDRCQVRTICGDQILYGGDQVTAHQLTQAGLLNIGQECIIKTDNFTLYSHKPYISEMKTKADIYTPVIAPINHIINITIPKLVLENKTQDLEEEFGEVDKQIQYMKKADVMLSDDLSNHDIHHYVMIYSLYGIMCIAVIIILTRRTQCKWRVPSSPSPSVAEELRTLPAVPAPPRGSGTRETSGYLDSVRVHAPRYPRVDIGTSP